MRNLEKRFPVEKLFVLGAGASFCATRPNQTYATKFRQQDKYIPSLNQTPLDAQFTGVISSMKESERPKWVGDSVKSMLSNWVDYKKFDEFGLEEAIQRHFSHWRLLRKINKKKKKIRNADIDEFMNDIIHVICQRLKFAKEGNEEIYTTLAKKFFTSSDGDKGGVSNRIITFNYDSVLDKILMEDPFNYDPRELYFSEIDVPNSFESNSLNEFLLENPILLKLHGSHNWMCDQQKIMEMMRWDGKSDSDEDASIHLKNDVNHVSPKDKVAPVILPPIPSKPITYFRIFENLWTRAIEYLSEAKEIVICGYSLPPSDGAAISLFSSFHNIRRLKKIVVVDPDIGIMRKWNVVLNRTGILKSVEWSYYDDFGNFVKHYK